MQRYFVDSKYWDEDFSEVMIVGDDVHHISRVMRGKIDDEIICIHPDQTIALCVISEIENDFIACKVIKKMDNIYELPIDVTIIQSLPKGDKLELIIQKSTELGAKEFMLYNASRSVVKWDNKKADKKLLRFNKIIKEAAEQSYRAIVPQISTPLNLNEMINLTTDYDIKLVAYEEEAKKSEDSLNRFSEKLKQAIPGIKICILIGPEGGFSESEITQFKLSGFIPITLGKRILRTETASLYALSAISYHFEEL